jgi:hypothetical protein
MRRTLPLLFGAALAIASAGAAPAQAAPPKPAPAVVTGEQAAGIETVESENYDWRRHQGGWGNHWRDDDRDGDRRWRGHRYPHRYSYYDPWRPHRAYRSHQQHYPYYYHRRPGITFEFSF